MPAPVLRLLLLLVLAGCAARPGPDVLRPVEATVPGAEVVPVYVATTRERADPETNVFTAGRARDANHAVFEVSVPPGHQSGQIEWPDATIDPARHFATLRETSLSRARFHEEVAALARGRQGVVVFVHGFNHTFPETLYRLTQMSADAHIDGVPVLFAWPSAAAVGGYVADRDSATYSRDALADLLTAFGRDRRIGTVTLIGHSMGAWLTMEALRQLRLTGEDRALDSISVVLAAPDIDVDVFRAQMRALGSLPAPITVLVSPDDRALDLSRRLGRGVQRLGTLDVTDPRVEEVARQANMAIIDISGLDASDGLNHDRYVALAALYPEMNRAGGQGSGGIRQAGAFVFNTIGAVIASPFAIVGEALSGE